MSGGWREVAQRILGDMQAKVSARDLPALLEFFEDPAVLIGAAGDGGTPEAREAYLEAIATHAAALRCLIAIRLCSPPRYERRGGSG